MGGGFTAFTYAAICSASVKDNLSFSLAACKLTVFASVFQMIEHCASIKSKRLFEKTHKARVAATQMKEEISAMIFLRTEVRAVNVYKDQLKEPGILLIKDEVIVY